MKRILYFFLFFPVYSMGQTTSVHYVISNSIVNYYLAKYAGDSDIRLEFSEDETSYTITSFSLLLEKEGMLGVNETITIPKSEGFIKGDMNADLKEDIIVTTSTEFGASGSSYEIFIFISNGNELKFFTMVNAVDLSFCPQQGTYAGNFTPTLIKNSIIYGTSECFTESDARCCPSLNYMTEFIFKNGLVFRKQELLN